MLEVASTEHVSAAVRALEEVARAVSVPAETSGASLHVALCHFQHDGFLNPDLHGFPALIFDSMGSKPVDAVPVVQDMSADDLVKLADDWADIASIRAIQSRKTAFFLDPGSSTPEYPMRLVVSMNDSIDMQIKAALSNVSLFLGRRKLIAPGASKIAAPTLPAKADAADQHAQEQVSDGERAQGWRAVAQQLREQSINQGTPLHVRYSAPGFSSEEIVSRAPAMRYVYNNDSSIRLAVDKVVSMTTQGMKVGGDGVSEKVLRFGQELIDKTQVQKFLAQAVRDSYVCGNGAISFGENPLSDLRVVDPDSIVEIDGSKRIRVLERGASRWLTNCLHVRGADQVNSQFGLSYLEPFVSSVIKQCMWLEVLITARAWAISPSTPQSEQVQNFVRQSPSLALAQLAEGRANMDRVLGSISQELPEPAADLYFSDHRLMRRPAPFLSMRATGEPAASM